MTPPLPRLFYLRPTLAVAHDLLGCLFVKRTGKKLLVGKIVEVEAYKQNDPASHSFHGQTQRNDVMFLEGGHLYVYFTYGMHFCANVVTGKEGIGEAVLIRAVEPLSGLETMEKNRFSVAQSHNGSITQSLNLSISQSPDPQILQSHNHPIAQSPNHIISPTVRQNSAKRSASNVRTTEPTFSAATFL
jgi:DNA-3-methyladenine glycosylase